MRPARTPGIYHLVLRLPEPKTVRIGRLGRIAFQAGYYVYTGSAMNGLEARIARHARRRKTMRWHIDFLLRAARLVEVVAIPTRARAECRRNCGLMAQAEARVPVPGFGSSDCRCPAHLAYFGDHRPDIATGPDGSRLAAPLGRRIIPAAGRRSDCPGKRI